MDENSKETDAGASIELISFIEQTRQLLTGLESLGGSAGKINI